MQQHAGALDGVGRAARDLTGQTDVANKPIRGAMQIASTLGAGQTGAGQQAGTGQPADQPAGVGRRCVRCGYDMAGLKSPRCPECGTLNSPRARRRERDSLEARTGERTEYTKPLVMFAVGLVLSSAIAAGVGDGVQDVLWHVMGYALYVPLGATHSF